MKGYGGGCGYVVEERGKKEGVGEKKRVYIRVFYFQVKTLL